MEKVVEKINLLYFLYLIMVMKAVILFEMNAPSSNILNVELKKYSAFDLILA